VETDIDERSDRVTIDGLGIRHARRGARRNLGDLPILVLHGWGASLDAVEPIVRGLEQDAEVWTLDLPGFGRSDAPPTAWDVDDYARLVLAYLAHHGIERCHVIGHSFGGRIAICLATSWPERTGRLLLCDSAGLRPRRGIGYRIRVGVAKVGRIIGRFGSPGRRVQERLRRRVASADYLQASEAMRGTFRRVIEQDLAERLPQIAAPTLIVWGEDDLDTPLWMGRRMEAVIPDAGLTVFEGAGHYSYADSPGRFARVARTFLCDQPRTASRMQPAAP
jgi:pimeloyl-ACP methyl ester carboxylesterase